MTSSKFFFQRTLTAFLTFSLFHLPIKSFAQFFVGPITTATGGAGRAAVDPLEGVYINPASMTQLRQYYMGAYYVDGNDLSTGTQRDMSIIIADSTPDKFFPAAFGYTKRRQVGLPSGNQIDQTNYHLAVADKINEKLSLGIGFHRLESRINKGDKQNQHNFDIGFLYTFTENIGIAAVFNDILAAGDSIDSEIALQTKFSLGFSYLLDKFVRPRLDWQIPIRDNPDNKSITMLGIESQFHEFFSIRFGARWDGVTGQNFAAVGTSFTGPRLSMDYTFEKETLPSDGGERHLIDLRLSF